MNKVPTGPTWLNPSYLSAPPNFIASCLKPTYFREYSAFVVPIYVAGMVAYSLSIITRVMGLIKDLLALLVVVFLTCIKKRTTHELNVRGRVFGGSCLEVVSAVIGTLLPSSANYLDERIQSDRDIRRHTQIGEWKNLPQPPPPPPAPNHRDAAWARMAAGLAVLNHMFGIEADDEMIGPLLGVMHEAGGHGHPAAAGDDMGRAIAASLGQGGGNVGARHAASGLYRDDPAQMQRAMAASREQLNADKARREGRVKAELAKEAGAMKAAQKAVKDVYPTCAVTADDMKNTVALACAIMLYDNTSFAALKNKLKDPFRDVFQQAVDDAQSKMPSLGGVTKQKFIEILSILMTRDAIASDEEDADMPKIPTEVRNRRVTALRGIDTQPYDALIPKLQAVAKALMDAPDVFSALNK